MDTLLDSFSHPPEWSLDTGYLGRFFIFLAIGAFALAAVGWLLVPRYDLLKKIAARSFTVGCVSLFGAFAALAILFINTRLEYVYVGDHGDAQNTIPYRIAGIWAGQEGSFLLWACCAAFFGLVAVRGTGVLRRWFTIPYAGFLMSLACILAFESPFGLNRIDGQPYVPSTGVGLTPALQNYWVTIHPPTIFLGFGSLTVLAAYAFAALASNQHKIWAPMVRPWALISVAITGVGLCMGGFWAYETLGWGGFWAWDPVENVSFVPWIFCIALVHGLMVQITKKTWVISNLLMGGLPFLLFVYGTFLTRSGVLNETSVHSFANMDHSALRLLLGFMGIATITFIALWTWRSLRLRKELDPSEPPPRGIHREGLFRLGAWLMAGLGLGAAIGMSWPMIMSLSGQAPKVVEAGLYHRTLTWLYVPLMIAMALGPLVAWRGMGTREFSKRIWGVFCITIAVVGALMMVVGWSPWTRSMAPDNLVTLPFGLKMGIKPWILLMSSLSVFVVVANSWRISELIKRSKMSAAAFLAHVGVALLMAGLIVSEGFEQKVDIRVQDGVHDTGLGYVVTYKGMTSDTTDRNNKVLFDVQNGNEKWTASPGLYYVPGADGQQQAMVWPHIQNHPFYDIYFALQPPTNELGVATTLLPGKATTINGLDVTFEKLTRDGSPGQVGTKWGALLKFSNGTETAEINPKMEIGQDGVVDHPAKLSDSIWVSMTQMQAADGSVTIQLLSSKLIYPATMFFKPMTILVWIGTFTMGFSALLSAYYRRRRRSAAAEAAPAIGVPAKKVAKPGRKAAAVGAKMSAR